MPHCIQPTTIWMFLAVPVVAFSGSAAPPPTVQPGGLSSAEVCGRCHRDILAAWKTSVHSRSMEDPVFQDCLEEARRRFGDHVQTRCLSCHAPTVAFSGDVNLRYKVSWEGVTCDFCHSVQQVDLRSQHPYKLQIGATKFGPLKDVTSGGHLVAFSKVHTDPEVCGGCHDARNENGLMVISSYTEWLESPAGADRGSCQSCHMAPVKANVVDPKVMRRKDARVNLHQMPGGHSVEQLNKALVARLVPRRAGDQLEVQLSIRNRGAGHMVPTGSPLRKLVVSLEVTTPAGRNFSAERTYRRVIVDAAGKVLEDEPGIWVRGARVASDNRIRANEERVELFRFDLPRSEQARIQARFWYHYSPMGKQDAGKIAFLVLPAIVSN